MDVKDWNNSWEASQVTCMVNTPVSYSFGSSLSYDQGKQHSTFTCERLFTERLFVGLSQVAVASRARRVRSSFSTRACWNKQDPTSWTSLEDRQTNLEGSLKFDENREEIRWILWSWCFTWRETNRSVDQKMNSSSSFSYRNILRIDWMNLELTSHLCLDDRLCPGLDWEILPTGVFRHSEKLGQFSEHCHIVPPVLIYLQGLSDD